jgi:hypothetical protein
MYALDPDPITDVSIACVSCSIVKVLTLATDTAEEAVSENLNTPASPVYVVVFAAIYLASLFLSTDTD